jgi:hypothetical protein
MVKGEKNSKGTISNKKRSTKKVAAQGLNIRLEYK